MWFTLTPKRILNYFAINISYLLSRLTGSLILWGKPYSLSIESAGTCQLSCPECPLGNKTNYSRVLMPEALFNKIIDECKTHVMVLSLYFQGEAFLNPQIFAFIKTARKSKIYTIASSNANFKTENWAKQLLDSGLNELIISLDGTNQKTYGTYRQGGDYSLVIKNLQALSELKKSKRYHTKIKIQFLVMQHNEHEIFKMKNLAKSLGFPLLLKSIQLQNPKTDTHLLPQKDAYRRYKKTASDFAIKNKLKNHCKRLFRNPVITSNGDVRPCCFDKAGKYSMGNITQTSFGIIWKSHKYKAFRTKVFSERKKVDICTNCTEGTRNIYV
ncbi:MAG: radical SAM/SPASM domain-containing protein [Bacteroidales bacterium]|jgi:radical SAM protein with 4Fe4S-binding SPASM domain|nr:radical SAM/SPASM domain-containing protein [Bacteroidales bacterium]